MEWKRFEGGRLRAYAHDAGGSCWDVYFLGFADCEGSPLHGGGVVLKRDGSEIAAWALDYYGEEAASMGYDIQAYVGRYVEEAMALADRLVAKDTANGHLPPERH